MLFSKSSVLLGISHLVFQVWCMRTTLQHCAENNKDTLVQALLYCNKVLENMFIFNCFISGIMSAQGKRELSMYFSGVQKHLFRIYANQPNILINSSTELIVHDSKS